jgi:hypothetical protein
LVIGRLFLGRGMDFELKEKLISFLLFIQTFFTLAIIYLTIVIFIYLNNIYQIFTIYIAILILSIVCSFLFMYLTWKIDEDELIDVYLTSRLRYNILILLITFQSLFIPFIAITIINIALFKIYSQHVHICFLSSVALSFCLGYRFFAKLNSFFYSDSIVVLNRLKFFVIAIQIVFILLDGAFLSWALKSPRAV